MMVFEDVFGRCTIIEVLPALYNNKISLVIRREKQVIYESLEVRTIESLIADLKQTLKYLEENNVNK